MQREIARLLPLPALLLAGCVNTMHHVVADKAHVDIGVFADNRPTVVRAYAARQTQEYLLFQNDGAQAELIYNVMPLVRDVAGVAVDAFRYYPFLRNERADAWKINLSEPKQWFGRGQVTANIDPLYGAQDVEFSRYLLGNSKRECFSFESVWDEPGYDPDFSPRKLIFGYYCAPQGARLEKDEIDGIIASIRVRNEPQPLERAAVPARVVAAADPRMVAAGQSPDTGIVRFPYLFDIVHGQIGGGDNDRK